MTSEILVNSSIGEIRMALVEEGKPVEIRLFRDSRQSLVGAIYYGRITALNREFQAAFVDLGHDITGFLPLALLPKRPGRKPRDLTELVHEGQKIIVQVTADAADDKSVRLTGRVEIVTPGLILHPFRQGAFVSSRIKDPKRREDLKIFGNGLDLRGMGLTIRTQAAEIPPEDLRKTAERLMGHWRQAIENRERKKVPFLLSQKPDSMGQIMREYASLRRDRIIFDRPSSMKAAQDWAREFSPQLIPRMSLHAQSTPLFEDYGVEAELDRIFERQIPLPSGAWITLEATEGMMVIDVNMGPARLETDPVRQRYGVNIAAAREIFRQIRLRGIGGIIVVDFINMQGKSDAGNLLSVIDNLMAEDPNQVQRSNLSAFGLLELTRKSRHHDLGYHMIRPSQPLGNTQTLALDLLRYYERDALAKPGLPVTPTTTTDIAKWLREHPEYLKEFTRRTGSSLNLQEE